MDPAPPPSAGAELIRYVTSVGTPRVERLDGRAGSRVDVAFDAPATDEIVAATGSVWFDRATGLVGEVRVDFTESCRRKYKYYPEAQPGETPHARGVKLNVEHAEYVYHLDSIEVDPPIAPTALTYSPPAWALKVDDFDYQLTEQRARQLELIGTIAPTFTGTLIDGAPFSFASKRGRVVVLQFWAAWWEPYSVGLPVIQSVLPAFKDKPVSFIGINTDRRHNDVATAFLARSAITFPQVNDWDDAVRHRYLVHDRPCTVIIDASGVIRDIRTEIGPGAAEALKQSVNACLKGEPVVTPEKLADRISAIRCGVRRDEPLATDDDTPDERASRVNPERLVAGDRFRALPVFSETAVVPLDMDADGASEQVIIRNREIVVVSADGRSSRAIDFKGIPPDSLITQLKVAHVGAEQRWAAVLIGYTSGTQSVAMFTADGELVWRQEVPIAERSHGGASLAVGNLAGDAAPEIACLSKVYGRGFTGGHAILSVYDAAGNTLSQDRLKTRLSAEMWIAPGPNRGTIMVAGDSALRRFTLDLSK